MSNWIDLEIKGKKYYLLCKINEKNVWDCLLYDGNESWYEQQEQETVIARVKEQNKKIKFNEATIKETLQNGQPTEVDWLENNSDNDDDDSRSLKLKYKVESCPFNFTWHFSKQSEHDFQKFILFPLFRIVQGLTQQTKELREIVRKKDVEIKQYKFEFGLLKRVTVSTQPFNVSDFDERYAETLELSKCMMQISDLLKAQYSQMKTPLKARATDKADNTVAAKRNEDTKLTPRRKRRKILEEKQRFMAEKMQAIQKPFAYESSQSQISSISQSDTESPNNSKKLLRSPRKSVELKIENDLDETPTKRTRIQKPSVDMSPAKLVKRNLNAGIEYDDSSDNDSPAHKFSNKNLLPTKTAEKANDSEANTSHTVRSSASGSPSPVKLLKATLDEKPTAAATSNSKNTGIYDFNDGSDDGVKSFKTKNKNLSEATQQTKTTEQTITCIKPSAAIKQKSAGKPAKSASASSASISTRLTRKNAGIEYEDSSDSPVEEKSYNKPSTSLNATPTKGSMPKITQSPAELMDDVQNLIDEWKALEKRRIADLKVRRN